MTDTAVDLRNVTKIFPSGRGAAKDVYAVRDLSLSIKAGEFFTLLGPSGCGKTTTLRLIAGFELPTEGEVFIQGQSVSKIAANRRPVNTVFQNYALFPHLSVAKNVGFGLAVKRVPRAEREKRVQEALALVQLEDMGQRKPSQLSGGQQQRVALARALVNRPTVLLLDEPLGALDLKLRKAMQIELKHLQEQVGITFVYVTHDQEEALTMSDRIAVMNKGVVLQIGDPVTLYEKPASQFVADFIGESNFIQCTLEGVENGLAQLSAAGSRIQAEMSDPSPQIGENVLLTIRPEKINLFSASDDPGKLVGIVEEVVYIGTDTRYIVTLPSNESIVARLQNKQGQKQMRFEAGDHVAVSWLPQDGRIVPAS
ncbi:MAG: ABC transporter ATP-binding protein [Ardenticatenaceae bacterium]|nr:ABC transporter ATP-binding protein [Ardenticatenaceae bacterium]MCB9444086.1 ABC transporter ATP-binding protein [Ardenticatenaceae bacterium]